MMHLAIKTMIFDFGNVVGYFDFASTWEKLLPHTTMSETQIRAAIAMSDLEDEYESGRMSTEVFVERMLALARLRCDAELLRNAWSDIFWPNAEVCALLPTLKSRYKLLLGSNTNELHAVHFRRQFAEHFQHFDELILSYEIGARKPKAQFFHACLERAGCEPSECIFIDDLPVNIAGARACGLHGIVYRNSVDLKDQLEQLGISLGK